MDKVNLRSSYAQIDEYWSPRVAALLNGQKVLLAKLKGEFVWRYHEDQDEMFLVVLGRVTIRFRDRDVDLEAGELLVVPRGVEHLPVANEEAHVILFEPVDTLNTGNVRDEHTMQELRPI
jgi:mannose-6-phosphate isomerase-like protein (cupin superfamily)